MKRKTLSSMLIALLLTTGAITSSPLALTRSTTSLTPCGCEGVEQNDKKSDNTKQPKHTKDDMGFWNNDNINLLNDTQKKQLETIREKIKKGETLTDDDKKTMFELKDAIVKSKLGEEKFNKFKALMEKKKNGQQLTDEEKKDLKMFFKELK